MRVLLLLVLLVVCGPAVPASAADWQWPLSGDPPVSRPFAPPAHRYAAGHRGADLPASPGAAVRAAGAGVVSYAGLVAGRGVVVVVHGPLRTTYEPVSAVVGVGDLVGAGEVLGNLEPGHAGCPVSACLHWGLRRGEDYLDPVRLVRPGPVRLLPLHGQAPLPALRAAGVPAGSAVGGAVGGGAAAGGAAAGGAAAGGAAAGGAAAGGAATGGDRRLLAPAGVRAPEPAVPGPTDVGLAAMAAASVLGAAVGVSVTHRRRR